MHRSTLPKLLALYDTNSDGTGTCGNNDINTDDSETYDEQNSSFNTIVKKVSFAHLYYDDVNNPAYDELRKELDEIFRNAQLQDIPEILRGGVEME